MCAHWMICNLHRILIVHAYSTEDAFSRNSTLRLSRHFFAGPFGVDLREVDCIDLTLVKNMSSEFFSISKAFDTVDHDTVNFA